VTRQNADSPVPRLLVLRDRTLQRYVELGRRELTIGRGEQNDVVLLDPDKLVSRFHAEIRPEGTGYVLIDLNSQNGTWVDAQRVERVAMRAGVPVAIGPYQLVLEDRRGSNRGQTGLKPGTDPGLTPV
jgi:pSer/pThr/pTyr-binding forkhead associated (FHA) protein